MKDKFTQKLSRISGIQLQKGQDTWELEAAYDVQVL